MALRRRRQIRFPSSSPRLWYHNRTINSASENLVGDSGRSYKVIKILQWKSERPDLNILLARSENQDHVVKPVSKSIFEHMKELSHAFPCSRRIRLPIDQIEAKRTLIFNYFTDDLLTFRRRFLDLPKDQLKLILWHVLKGIQELHGDQWVHGDLKADNVMIAWQSKTPDEIEITRVVLSDTDCAARLPDGKLVYARLGNPMWRAPEAQVGVAVGRPSDIYSFGILCIFVLFNEVLFPIDLEELRREGVEPEMEVLFQTVSRLGNFPPGLLEHVQENEEWCGRLTAINQAFDTGFPRE